jgi:hypothetical protein
MIRLCSGSAAALGKAELWSSRLKGFTLGATAAADLTRITLEAAQGIGQY